MTDSELIEKCEAELKRREPRKPWVRASTLARKFGVSIERVDRVLSESASKPLRGIRNSKSPSAVDLGTLWGYIGNVGELNNPGVNLAAIPFPSPDWPEDLTKEVFLSHSHGNTEKALELANRLAGHGVGSWLAEYRIQEGEVNHTVIQNALDRSEGVVLYLTRQSLSSTWCRKEVCQAASAARSIFVILEGDDESLLESTVKWKSATAQGQVAPFLELLKEIFAEQPRIGLHPWTTDGSEALKASGLFPLDFADFAELILEDSVE